MEILENSEKPLSLFYLQNVLRVFLDIAKINSLDDLLEFRKLNQALRIIRSLMNTQILCKDLCHLLGELQAAHSNEHVKANHWLSAVTYEV